MTALLELLSGDAPEAWGRLGFAVHDGAARVGSLTVRLDGAGGGLRGWTLQGGGTVPPPSVGGVPTAWVAEAPAGEPGARALDHVVLLTDDRDAAVASLVAAGGDERRRAGPPDVPVAMSFVRLGEVIVEVAEGGGPPRLWGLVAVVDDLAALGDIVGDPKPAVQPGRQIATVRPQAGLETALAFMTPRVRAR